MNEHDVVARLYEELVEALREKGDDAPQDHWRVTVAEIYQDLVPYRRARSSLGVDMNADYEQALLRLLAGEGDRVRLEPVEARHELEGTLQTSNPDVTLYRKFAACDVEVAAPSSADPVSFVNGAGTEDDVPSDFEADSDLTPAAEPDHSELRIGPPPERGRERAREGSGATEPRPEPASAAESGTGRFGATGTCPGCDRRLPAGPMVHFCPYCGTEQPRACRECGTAVEPDWSFCAACGEPTETTTPGG